MLQDSAYTYGKITLRVCSALVSTVSVLSAYRVLSAGPNRHCLTEPTAVLTHDIAALAMRTRPPQGQPMCIRARSG